MVDRVLEVTRKHGKIAGIFTQNPDEVKLYRDLGMRFIIYCTDMGVIAGAIRKARAEIQ